MAPRRGFILREGYPFVAFPAVFAGLGFGVGWWTLAVFCLMLAVVVALFFRNPVRNPPAEEGAAVSPADGRVVEVARVADPEGTGSEVWKIGIFMSVFNVHVNRSPVGGEVLGTRHERGRFHSAFRSEASRDNERNVIRIRAGNDQTVTCVQIAGSLARRIVCWVRQGARLSAGDPVGMIRFGSRVDSYFPVSSFEPRVRVGQRVRGGQSIVGYFR